jgi:hypothetical protein
VLSGLLSDRVANTHSETQSVIFGQGFPRITDLKVGIGDGYLYVLTIGDGKIYRIVPKATTMSLASETEPPWQGETGNSKTRFSTSNEMLNIDTTDISEVERNMDNNKFACQKMEDRIDDIDQQDKRDWLTEEEADELKNRIDSIMNNLDCD